MSAAPNYNRKFCVVMAYLLIVSGTQSTLGAINPVTHEDYRNLRSELEMLMDGVTLQESLTQELVQSIEVELPVKTAHMKSGELNKQFHSTMKEIIALQKFTATLHTINKIAYPQWTSNLGHHLLVLNKITEDVCTLLFTIAGKDNCTIDVLEPIYMKLDYKGIIGEVQDELTTFVKSSDGDNNIIGPTSNLQCSWFNHHILNDCVDLTSEQLEMKTYVSGRCTRGRIADQFHLCFHSKHHNPMSSWSFKSMFVLGNRNSRAFNDEYCSIE